MPNINDVQLMQFSNREGQLVAGFTPEHAVYDTNGIRLDVKLKALDIDRIYALLKRFNASANGGIAAIFEVKMNEASFMEEVEQTMATVNGGDDSEELPFNTYLAVLAINFYNFMEIELPTTTPDRIAYTLAKVYTCVDGGYDVFFELDFNSYRYHFNKTILDEDGNPQSELFFEESGLKD